MVYGSEYLTEEEYVAAAKAEVETCDNGLISGRIPPGVCLGLFPAPKDGEPGIREIYPENGGMFAALKERMPEPTPIPSFRADLNQAFSPNAPGFSPAEPIQGWSLKT